MYQQNNILSDIYVYILSEKREDRADYSYNDDGVGVLPVQETMREVKQGVIETAKISVSDKQDQDQELRKIKLSLNGSSLVEILRNHLNDKNSVNKVTPSGSISTADLVSTQSNCTSSSETSIEVLEKEVKSPVTSKILKGYFCSDTVFNLNKKVLTETEIGVFERDLGFVPRPDLINEENLRRDLNDFSRKNEMQMVL